MWVPIVSITAERAVSIFKSFVHPTDLTLLLGCKSFGSGEYIRSAHLELHFGEKKVMIGSINFDHYTNVYDIFFSVKILLKCETHVPNSANYFFITPKEAQENTLLALLLCYTSAFLKISFQRVHIIKAIAISSHTNILKL